MELDLLASQVCVCVCVCAYMCERERGVPCCTVANWSPNAFSFSADTLVHCTHHGLVYTSLPAEGDQ